MTPNEMDMGLGDCKLIGGEPAVGLPDVELPPVGENPEYEVGYTDPPQLTVVDGGLTEDFPDVVPEEAQPADYPNMAMQVALHIQQVVQSGEQIVALLLNPSIHDGVVEALKALPDEAYPAVLKEKLPISASPDVEGAQVITHSAIERQFLERYFGPREIGGTGMLPILHKYLSDTQSPVMITVEFLRNKYLQEIVDRVVPNIVVPTTSNVPRDILRR